MLLIDPELIHVVQAGDLEAFEKLVRITQQKGLNIAYGILYNTLDAEEVLQEAYLNVYKSLNRLKAPEAFYNWFTKIIINLAYRKAKERGRYKSIPYEDYMTDGTYNEGAADEENPEKIYLQKVKQEELKEILKGLPDEYRTTLILREWEGNSYQEISEIFNIPVGTVKSRLNKARKIIISKLTETEVANDGK